VGPEARDRFFAALSMTLVAMFEAAGGSRKCSPSSETSVLGNTEGILLG
jgi:hypothetical protein